MSIWQFIKQFQTGSQQKKTYEYTLGEPVQLNLTDPATQETLKQDNPFCDPQAVSPSRDQTYFRWLSFSPREQDVLALTCLGYTNRQIASRLGISAGTVKSYIQNVLNKMGLHSKVDLRLTFYGWDFSAWN
jgi:DNA-binding NarL/FixJ family response regulator